MSPIELTPSRDGVVGHLGVRRALPTRKRRTVGAWCFADHMGPADVTPGVSGIGPHPHIGLATVTWLLDGELLHRDSLGSEQTIRPGQLNLMTAGGGVQHAEESTRYSGTFEGIQLWVALPDATRHGPAAFEHHAELPRVEVGRTTASVLLGGFAGARSAARTDTDLVGVDLDLRGPTDLPLRSDFEYALVVLRGQVGVGDTLVAPGALAYLGSPGDQLRLDVPGPARAMLLGGVPLETPVTMWWNFVGRTKGELAQAGRDWNDHHERFGVIGSSLDRIPAPPWVGVAPA